MSSKPTNKTFDQGASEAMPNTDLSSGIYEVPQPSTSDDRDAGEAQGINKTPGKVDEGKPDNSITQKVKDTAGAGAMIL
ncbi:hypothetical protein F5Y09DRAFT_291593 [Xylaria sp. FL1042]|nr:hypothetical protein F5Y09DRAFT_291593 [Xylaria sp. FL1042]